MNDERGMMNAELKASYSSFRAHHSLLSCASAVNGPAPRIQSARLAFMLLLLLLSSGITCAAIPFDTYRDSVRQAATALDALSSPDEGEDEAARSARIIATLRRVRESVPLNETIEWNDKTLVVDNSWLDAELNNYEKLIASDPQRADALRARITERLYAIHERLAETDGEETDGAASRKDEEKGRLAAILRRDEYQQKAAEGSALERLWQRFLKWLGDLFPDAKPLRPGNTAALSRVAQGVVFALSIGVIAFVLWRFGPRLFGRRRSVKRGGKREARVVLGERLAPDQTASDLLAEAEALAREGDLRAAIRKGYIALLCGLDERKIIRLAGHKTNRDYLRTVGEATGPLYEEMKELTASFENHWYGFAPATEDDWKIFRSRYQKVSSGAIARCWPSQAA